MKSFILLFLTIFLISCNIQADTQGNTQVETIGNLQTKTPTKKVVSWKVVNLEGEKIQDIDLNLQFDPAKEMAHGRAACNTYRIPYKMGNNDSLSFSGALTTKMFCADNLNRLESKFLNALSRTKSFTNENGVMTFITDKGKIIFNEVK